MQPLITSSKNPQIKNIIQLNKKAKERREQGLYVVEGIRMYAEAPADQVEQVYVAEHFLASHPEISQKYPGCEVVADSVFESVSDTRTPQGILCLVKQVPRDIHKVLELHKEAPFFVILEDIQDPGNLGTIIRTAEGAGVDGIILSANCVDIYNPKTIRSTMGSVFRMPLVYAEDMNSTLGVLKENHIRTFAAHLSGKQNYDMEDYTSGTALLIGNEGNGLSDNLTAMADELVKIPMCGQVESLNAAMAAGILMYETARQRRLCL